MFDYVGIIQFKGYTFIKGVKSDSLSYAKTIIEAAFEEYSGYNNIDLIWYWTHEDEPEMDYDVVAQLFSWNKFEQNLTEGFQIE